MTWGDSDLEGISEFSLALDSNRATGKRNSESLASDVRSVVTGQQSSENTAVIAICESRGSLSEVGVAIYLTDTSVCHLQQVQKRR